MVIDDGLIKKRIADLFTYIREIKIRLDKPILNENEYSWILNLEKELPDHPSVKRQTDDYFLKVKRPEEIACPSPPAEVLEWLKPSWKSIRKELDYLRSKNVEDDDGGCKTIFINDYPDLVDKIERWSIAREEWRKAEWPNEAVRKVYSKLHEARARIEKDGDAAQLYLTEGVLCIKNEEYDAMHPIVYKEIDLRIVSGQEPEIIVTKSNTASSIYVAMLRELKVSGSILHELKRKYKDLDIDPDDKKIELFLQHLVHTIWRNGKFSNEKVPAGKSHTVYLESKLLMGKKESQFIEQINSYIKKIHELEELPIAYQNIVGYFKSDESDSSSTVKDKYFIPKNSKDYFLTKEYNSDQKKIIDFLESNGCVSVQGPPGTGKSHTIANLIGHLLAKGQSVLVSAYRSKALEVIRDQVVKEIRPLCVSILDNQKDNKEQLNKAVSYLGSLNTKYNLPDIDREIKELKLKRKKLKGEIIKLEEDYTKCIQNEYRSFSFMGEEITPIDAAKYISENDGLPIFDGPFLSDITPLSTDTLQELRNIFKNVSYDEQKTIESSIPNSNEIIKPDEFRFFKDRNFKIKTKKSAVREREYLIFQKIDSAFLEIIKNLIDNFLSFPNEISEIYLKKMMNFILEGEGHFKKYKGFVLDCNEIIDKIDDWRIMVDQYDPYLDLSDYSFSDLDELISCSEKLCERSNHIKTNYLRTVLNKKYRDIKERAMVCGRKISTKDEMLSLVKFLKIEREKEKLKDMWNRLIFPLGAKKILDIGKDTYDEIKHRIFGKSGIEAVIQWRSHYNEIKQSIEEQGIIISGAFKEEIKLNLNGDFRELDAVIREIIVVAKDPLDVALEEKYFQDKKQQLTKSVEYLKKFYSKSSFNKLLYDYLMNQKCDEYGKCYYYLKRLEERTKMICKLTEYTSEIYKTAPLFATKLKERKLDQIIFNLKDIPKAWRLSYLEFKINERNSIDPAKIHNKLIDKKDKLKKIDSILINSLSVQNQLSKITKEQRQALRGFVIIQNKITKSGKGVRDVALKKNSRQQIAKCRGAVPVWIMPLSKVMDNFVIGENYFDVLIIDEASQADITNLPILSMAKRVIIVGDDKQVSPSAAGVSLRGTDALIDEHLENIPNRAIYDYRASLYDIACSSFGETIRLTEHFRCTPEIIQFCNDLQYGGEIKALRSSNSNPTPPSIIPFYVEGDMDSFKKNRKEAIKIASIVIAMTKNKKYEKSTIGVISLFGYMQHQYIDRLLQSTLSPAKYEKHKIVCGKAPQFQGDERNIIFLSMVESPTSEGPLRRKSATDAIKKEYNVAVSRAKDQLWIMHSMNLNTHLQPDDIRLRLLAHAHNPKELVEKNLDIISLAESEFEKSVHKDLLREGYYFEPQYEVGAYRIDIVLFTSDKRRIALECDGERYHYTEEQIKNDLARQRILERLGFVFIRIRGSDYYRKQKETISSLFKQLGELKVVRKNEKEPILSESKCIDKDLIKEAEKILISIEKKIEEGIIEDIQTPFNSWKGSLNRSENKSISTKYLNKKNVLSTPYSQGIQNEGVPLSGSCFKYSKFFEDDHPNSCLSCGKEFFIFSKNSKNKMSFGYRAIKSISWYCKYCFNELKVDKGWRT